MDFDIQASLQQCAAGMDQSLIAALVRRESNFNPFAIGMDGKAYLPAQPRTIEQAVAKAEQLAREGKTFSVGLAQIHVSNIRAFGASWRQSFDPCTSLRYAQNVYQGFLAKARKAGLQGDAAIFAALRGYNSGNIFAQVSNGYASAILANAGRQAALQPISQPIRAGPQRRITGQEAEDAQAQEMAESHEL